MKRRLREKKCIVGRAWSFVVLRLDSSKRSTFDDSFGNIEVRLVLA